MHAPSPQILPGQPLLSVNATILQRHAEVRGAGRSPAKPVAARNRDSRRRSSAPMTPTRAPSSPSVPTVPRWPFAGTISIRPGATVSDSDGLLRLAAFARQSGLRDAKCEVRPNLRSIGAFHGYRLASVCRSWRWKRHSGALSPRAIFPCLVFDRRRGAFIFPARSGTAKRESASAARDELDIDLGNRRWPLLRPASIRRVGALSKLQRFTKTLRPLGPNRRPDTSKRA